MKKIFTLLMVLALSVGIMNAGDLYQVYWQNAGVLTQTPSGSEFFTFGEKKNTNANYAGTYKASDNLTVTSSKGLKIESATTIEFTTLAKSTVVIARSTKTNPEKTILFDGVALEGGVANPSAGDENVLVYTLTDVEPGAHKISRGSGEAGLVYVGVEYTGAMLTELAAPEVTFDATTGLVTIGAVENATKVVYTTDGSNPTAESTEYTAPFTVADGTTVKAMAVGDDETYGNSKVAEAFVILTGVVIEQPVINQFNGTFAVLCSTPLVTVEYSLDGGATWSTYYHAVTLYKDATVDVRISREGSETVTAQTEVFALPAVEKTLTVPFGNGSGSTSTIDGLSTITAKANDAAEGYKLVLNMSGKSYSGGNKITMDIINGTRTAIKGSNGAQNILYIPEGYMATRLYLFSYMNYEEANPCGWKEVNGVDYSKEVVEVPCGAFPSLGTDIVNANPDVRVFNLDNVEGALTFTNTGTQMCFTLAVDVVKKPEAPEAPKATVTVDGVTSEVEGDMIDGGGEDVTIELASDVEGAEIYYAFSPNAAVATQARVASIDRDGVEYALYTEALTFNRNGVLSYFTKVGDLMSDITSLTINGTTGIENVAVDANAPAVYYNLQGVRVAEPAQGGLYIVRRGNTVAKELVK